MHPQFDDKGQEEKLARLRVEEEEDVTRLLSEKYSLPYTDLSIVPINMDALRVIPENTAREAEAIAFDKSGKNISLAIPSPDNDSLPELLESLHGEGYIVQKFLISHQGFKASIERYKDLSLATESHDGVFDVTGAELTGLTEKLSTLSGLRAFLSETLEGKQISSVSHVFEGLMIAAFSLKASDIHIEPGEDAIRIRYRLDGILTDIFEVPPNAYRLITSRIKILSGLKLNITDRAQDGRFSVAIRTEEVEVRTSIIPGNYGESIVLRILDESAIKHSFLEMGLHPKLLDRLASEIRRPNGMLLTTGPTGSGKTTTLYSFLREIHTPEIKIVTIEDPVEYHVQGIVQTQTNGKEYTFASGLRSVLRQDPDVIMVGEIRDAEVAEVAVQAALTGHFVFSTLHTNNAAGAFPRLVDLGVDPKTFSSAISVVMGQRLVRTLDPDAKRARETTAEEKSIMKKIFEDIGDRSFVPSFDAVFEAAPLSADQTGYRGRTGLHEAIFMDDELGEFLRENPSSSDILKVTRRQGYLTMAQDGVLKAIEGVTSLEEVFKVIDLPRG